MMRRNHWSISFFLDFLLGLFVLVLLAGGIDYQGHLYVSHGTDLRRSLLLIWGGFALFLPQTLKESLFCQSLSFAFRALRSSSGRKKAGGSFLFFALFFTLSQTLAFRVPLYDVGIYHQLFWALGEGLGFYSTISGNHFFLLDHFCPSIIILLPLFKALQWIHPNSLPFFLPVLQVFLLLGGAGAWLYLASRFKKERLSQVVFCFILSFQSLWGNMRWGFHENALAFLCISWAMVFIFLREKKLASLILLLIGAFCKEILLLDVALIFTAWGGLSLKKNPRWATGLFILSGALCLGFIYFELLPHPEDKNYFQRYYSYLGLGLKEMYTHFSLSSFFLGFQENVGLGSSVRYLFRVFLPWLGLPIWMIVKKKKEAFFLIGMIPSFFSALLATYAPLRDTNYHYALELWPILAPLTILSLKEIRQPLLPFFWVWITLFQLEMDPLSELRKNTQSATEFSSVRQKIREIPTELSLVADELSGPWVAGRAQITRFADFNEKPTLALLHEEGQKEILPGAWQILWHLGGWTLYKRDL